MSLQAPACSAQCSALTNSMAQARPAQAQHRSCFLGISMQHMTHSMGKRVNAKRELRSNNVSAGSRRPGVVHGTATAASAAPPAVQIGDDSSVYDTIIVGAGVSGLCTALALQADHNVTNFVVTEGRDRVGGNVTSLEGGGYVWEEGPNSFQPNDSMLKIAVEAGVDKDLVFGDPKAPRFVYWENKLRATPSGPDALTFDLLSIWGKIRAGLGAIGIKAGAPGYEESVEQFIRRNLGEQVFQRLIEPFCSGVYAGDPAKLSMKAAFGRIQILEEKGGSLVGGAIKLFQERKANPPPPRDPRLPPKPKGQTVGSFRKGLQMLPEAIAAKLGAGRVRCNWQLKSVSKGSDGVFSLQYSTPEGEKSLRARSVALTVPAYVAADLLEKEAPKAAEGLRSFDYPPVGSVTLSYPLSALRDDRMDENGALPGFGQLHPRTQGITTLGTIYSSSLFPGRAPDGNVLLLNYIGGATNRGIVDQTSEQLSEQVDRDLRKMLLKPDAPKPQTVGVRVWPRAIPQFNIGHLDTLESVQSAMKGAGLDGVMLGGNYVSGVALGKCVEYAYEYAGKIAGYVKAGQKA